MDHFSDEQGPFESYIDHVSLCMLHAPDVDHLALQRHLRVERCTFGFGELDLERAGADALKEYQNIE